MAEIMNRRAIYLLLFILATAAIAGGVWTSGRFRVLRLEVRKYDLTGTSERHLDPGLWARSVEKVKEDRGGSKARNADTK